MTAILDAAVYSNARLESGARLALPESPGRGRASPSRPPFVPARLSRQRPPYVADPHRTTPARHASHGVSGPPVTGPEYIASTGREYHRTDRHPRTRGPADTRTRGHADTRACNNSRVRTTPARSTRRARACSHDPRSDQQDPATPSRPSAPPDPSASRCGPRLDPRSRAPRQKAARTSAGFGELRGCISMSRALRNCSSAL